MTRLRTHNKRRLRTQERLVDQQVFDRVFDGWGPKLYRSLFPDHSKLIADLKALGYSLPTFGPGEADCILDDGTIIEIKTIIPGSQAYKHFPALRARREPAR